MFAQVFAWAWGLARVFGNGLSDPGWWCKPLPELSKSSSVQMCDDAMIAIVMRVPVT